MSDFLNFNPIDEIIDGQPKYNVTDNADGTKNIELANEIVQEGTALNKFTLDKFKKINCIMGYNTPNIESYIDFSKYSNTISYSSPSGTGVSNVLKIGNRKYFVNDDKMIIMDLELNEIEKITLSGLGSGYYTRLYELDNDNIFITTIGTGSRVYDYYTIYNISNKQLKFNLRSKNGQYYRWISAFKLNNGDLIASSMYSNGNCFHYKIGIDGTLTEVDYQGLSFETDRVYQNTINAVLKSTDTTNKSFRYYTIDESTNKLTSVNYSNIISFNEASKESRVNKRDYYLNDNNYLYVLIELDDSFEIYSKYFGDIVSASTKFEDFTLVKVLYFSDLLNGDKILTYTSNTIHILYAEDNSNFGFMYETDASPSGFTSNANFVDIENTKLQNYTISYAYKYQSWDYDRNYDKKLFDKDYICYSYSNNSMGLRKRDYIYSKNLYIDDLILINNVECDLFIPSDYVLSQFGFNYLNNKIIDTNLEANKRYKLYYNEDLDKWIAKEEFI